MRRPRGLVRRLAVVTAAAMALGAFAAAPSATAAPAPNPAAVGLMSMPFEEGGSTPNCATATSGDQAGRIVCKPTAVSTFMLPNGKLLYWMGLESLANVRRDAVTEGAPESREDQSRVLDLTKDVNGVPRWTVPGNQSGGATNPNIVPGRDFPACLAQDPQGVAGVPGRPGDGFVGSMAGQLGTPPSDYSCSPDDPEKNDGNMFCADVSMLGNGVPLVVGGTDWYNEPAILDRAKGDPTDLGIIELEGLRAARTFDYTTNTWHATAPMRYGRWYPGTVTLPNGDVFTASGTAKLIKSTQGSQVRRTETYHLASNTWEANFTGPASENSLPQNPRLFLTPNGKIFYNGEGQTFGPFGQAVDEALWGLRQFFNLQTKQWEVAGATMVRGSPGVTTLPMTAPYDTMRMLSVGGTLGPSPGSYLATPLTTLTTVDKAGHVVEAPAAPLHHARWFPATVQMPDGQVFVTNGADKDEVVNPGFESPVHETEMFDPATGAFTDMAPIARDKTYHNSATLLPDGRVLIGGHSPIPLSYTAFHTLVPGVTANNQPDSAFQIFSPPYLFNGPRPHITTVHSALKWGEDFTITTPDAASVDKVVLMRTPSQQHVFDSDVRTLLLPFHRSGTNTLTATVPPTPVAAPPGTYYLFVDKKGADGRHDVPSVARMLHVGDYSNSATAIEPMSGAMEDVSGVPAPGVVPNGFLDKPPSPGIGGLPSLPGLGGTPALPDLPVPGLPTPGLPGLPGLPAPAKGQPAAPPLGGVQLPGGLLPSTTGRRGRRPCRA